MVGRRSTQVVSTGCSTYLGYFTLFPPSPVSCMLFAFRCVSCNRESIPFRGCCPQIRRNYHSSSSSSHHSCLPLHLRLKWASFVSSIKPQTLSNIVACLPCLTSKVIFGPLRRVPSSRLDSKISGQDIWSISREPECAP